MYRTLLPGTLWAVLFSQFAQAGDAHSVAGIRLTDTAGKTWSLDEPKDAKAVVVVFLGTQCPINNAYIPRLGELHAAYSPKGVAFLAINANEHDTSAAIRDHAKKYKLPFPVLKDDGQRAAGRFGAERVPEAFVLDSGRVIRYQGRIDDQYGVGYQRPQPSKTYLRDAIEEVLAGKTVATAKTAVEGCYITRAPQVKTTGTVTFAKDVAPILQNRCQECHRPGQIGPMPLLSYDDASSWSQMIRDVVADRRMPPWHADPKFGKFFNDRSLSTADRETLLAWIDQGCAKGDDKDLPQPRKYVEGWRIGQPDAVVTMTNEFMVPAQAPKKGIPYKYVVVPTNFDEDKWIQSAEAKPGNPAVVHHIIVYVTQGGKRVKDVADGIGSGMLVAYAPGDFGSVYAPGAAKKIAKGSSLIFQMHYTPNGVEQSDRSSVGFIFAKEPPKHEVKTKAIAQQLLYIQPGEDNQQFKSIATFRKDAIIWNMTPHMHLRGKDFTYVAVTPDGKRETLLSVPRYDFGWQASYRYEKPLLLPAGSRIECTAHFDNSPKNLSNPDPTKLVLWGEQTWEEMMIGFVDYSYVEGAEKKDSASK
jgi:peroxiredoxin